MDPQPALSTPTERADTTPAPAANAGNCDELTCLVDPNAACCAKQKAKGSAAATSPDSGTGGDATTVEPSLPKTLTREEIDAGLRPVRGRIEACGDRHGFTGAATIKLRVSASGTVLDSSISAGTPEFQACLVEKVRLARFAPTQDGSSIRFPLVFR
jgi:hypothetical protein